MKQILQKMQRIVAGSFVAFVFCFSISSANAQVNVTASAGTLSGSYTTLKNTFDAINAGTHQGTITISLTGDVVETASAVLNASGTGSSTYIAISIMPSGGALRTISGTLAAPLIDLNGADNVTINGSNAAGDALTIFNSSAVSTAGTSTIRFINDATSNLITNCTILGASTGTASQNAGSAAATTATILFSGSTGTTGNDNNTISNNTIADGATLPTVAIGSAGTSTALSNDNITISGNNISNFYGASGANGIDIASNSSAWTISGNKFYQTASRSGLASASYLECIYVNTASGSGYTIQNNVIGYANNTGTGMFTNSGGRFVGIDLAAVAATPVSNIQGNTINGINWTTASGASTAGASPVNFIVVKAGGVNIGTTSGNTIGSATGTGSATSNVFVTSTSNGTGIFGIYATSSAAVTIQNNTIGALATSGAATIGYAFTGIQVAGSGNHVISGNGVGNNTVSGISIGTLGTTTAVCSFTGINAGSNGSALSIGNTSGTGNTIQNVALNSTSATSSFTGITNTAAASVLTINYNTIRGIVMVTGAITGIINSGNFGTSASMNNNNLGDATAGFVTFSAASSGALTGISNVSGSGAASSTLSISNNDLKGIVHSVAGTSAHTYIFNAAARPNTNINGNTFTNLNVNTTGSVTFISNTATHAANTIHNVNNNSIVTAYVKGGSGGTIIFYDAVGSSGTTVQESNTGNNFSNLTFTGATIYGWRSADGSTSSPYGSRKTVTGNTFSNITNNTSGSISGLYVGYCDNTYANSNVSNNTITNITGAGNITGMLCDIGNQNFTSNTISNLISSGASAIVVGMNDINSSTQNINSNIISNLSSPGATAQVMGIYVNTTGALSNVYNNIISGLSAGGITPVVSGINIGTGVTTTNVYGNKIYGISGTAAITSSGALNGILIQGGTTNNVYNNVIGAITSPIANSNDVIRGIGITSTTATSTNRIYDNSIYLNAISTGTNFGSTGIYHTVSATATTSTLDLQNNIIINESTPNGTGLTTALRRSGIALTNFASASNRNMLYAGNPAATQLLMYDGTNSYQTITAYQTVVLPREINSFAGEAAFTGSGFGTAGNFFISLTGSSTDFLRPVTGITTQAEAGGSTITTPAITTDFAGATRSGTPDVGAYEFAGISPAPVITLNSVTPPTTSQCTATARVVSVNITTVSGTIAGATIGYTVNGVPQTNIVMTNSGGSTWTGTIPVPTPVNALIAWGVAASNSIGLNSSYVGTPYSDAPLFGVTVTATNSANLICAGSPSTLTATISKSGFAASGTGSATIGTAGTGDATTPFAQYYETQHTQYLVMASDLTTAGLSAGNITNLAFTVTTKSSTKPFTSYNIKLANSALTALTNGNNSATFTTVYSASSTLGTGVSSVAGVNNFAFGTGGTATSFAWDGTSNILVDICYANDPSSSGTYYSDNDVVAATTKSYVATYGYYIDNANLCGTTNGINISTSSKLPNFIFTGNTPPAIQTISWSDGATTVGTTNPLTVTPTTTTIYTASLTALGCLVTPAPTTTVTVNPVPGAPTATNSAQCGVQVPTASVASTTGLPTPTFKWYAASSGGSALQTSVSTTYTSTVGTTTTFYVSELNTTTGCESVRTPVTVNVSTPDPVTVAASSTSVCLGSSFTLTGSNTNGTPFQNYTYSFQSPTTGSGAETSVAGNPVTITPTVAGTFVYTLTGVDGGCAATSTVSVVINALPVISSATATPATVCSGDVIALQAQSIIIGAGAAPVGSGASSSSGNYYIPFYHLFGGQKDQYIVRASELTAAGLSAGNITALGLNITTVGTTYAGFTVHIGNTPNTDLSAGFVPVASLTQVYSNATLTLTASSLNTFTFGTPFNWDGVSNIVVQTSWSNNNTGGSSSGVAYDNTAYISNAYYSDDSFTPAAILAATPADGTASARPKMTFTGTTFTNLASSLNWSWTPGTGLNTAVASTSVTNNSGSPITQAYTVTATNTTTGCSSSVTTPAVTINSAPTAPTATNSIQCGQGVPTASVTGTGTPGNTFAWYTVPTGGTAISGQTGNSLSGYTISATTTFYVAESNGSCQSPRVPVTATVTTPPTISVSGTATICNGSSVSLTASSSNDPNYTYTWSGGLGTGATVSASPSSNITYTVTATDASGGTNNGCLTTADYSIAVNPTPSAVTANASSSTICEGTSVSLTSTGSSSIPAFTYTEGFEAWPPTGWTFINAGSGNQWGAGTSAYTGSGAMMYTYSFSSPANAWGITPGQNLMAGRTYTVSFWYKTEGGTTYPERMRVTVGSAATVAGQATVLWQNNGGANLTNTTYAQGTATFTPSTSGTYYFGFNCYSATNRWLLHVDDISIVSPAPVPTFAWSSSPAGYTSSVQNPTGVTPTTTTTYTVTVSNSNGCSATASKTVTVNHPTTSSLTQTACSSYTLNGSTYTASGTYVQHLTNAAGCDSAITLNLTITQPTTSTLTQTACSSYTLNGTTYNTSGTYTQVLPGANAIGCDSTITLNLTINQPTTSTLTQTACSSYTLNGTTYNTSGTYTQVLPGANAVGCDSTITLNLTINQPTTSTLTQTACSSYTLNGTTYNTSGTYTQVLPGANAAGCDSTITLNLTINQPTTSTLTQTACSSYTLNGTTYNTSGTYTQVLPGANAAGCDSTITLNLTINQPTTSTLTQTACSSYTLNGTTYNTSGTYTQVLPGANAIGCDSTITLNLTINQPTTSTLTQTACSSYTLNGTTYNTSGTYTQVLPGANAVGCDSTITLNLTINQPTASTVNGFGCNSYTYNGTTYNVSGTYTQTLMNAASCDSIVTLIVALTNSFDTIDVTACSSYTYNSITYTASGTYSQVFANIYGCDSTIVLNLTINQPTTNNMNVSACTTYTLNGSTYTASGTYVQHMFNAAGCDSTINLNLTINQPTTAMLTQTACSSYTLNGSTYNTSGTYVQHLTNAAGCDSMITLNLTINQPSTSTITATACGSYTLNGTQYNTSGTYTQVLPAANASGCDSTITLNLTINQPSTSTITATACGSYTLNGTQYNTSGTYTQVLPAANASGCDSTITLNLTINQPTTSTITTSACGSYTLNGTQYNTSGTYTQVLPAGNASGCDSTITLNLTIGQPTENNISAVECSSYVLNGTTYTASGTYIQVLPAANATGCDSTINLTLTINQPTTSTTTIVQCGGTYTWTNGVTYNTSGTHTQTLVNAVSCDSIATLVLTINSLPVATATVNSNATITASGGSGYQWINCTTGLAITGATAQTFAPSANGSYAVVVSNGSGCSDTSTCVTVNNVGIMENTSVSIAVYPNPTHNEVTVTMDAASATIEVADAQGKLLQTTQVVSGGKVDLSTYETGVYFLRISTEYGSVLERIVKN